MKVLAIIDSLSLGGAERLLAFQARAARERGDSLDVASVAAPTGPRDAMAPVLEAAGVTPTFLGVPRLASRGAVATIRRAIEASGCDVVHAHLEYAATLVPPAASLVGRRTVCTFHHVPSPLPLREAVKERLAVEVASSSAAVVFVSRASRDAFAARYSQRPNWLVVPNGIDLDEFVPSPAATMPDDLALPPGTPTAVLVANMRGGKGHEHAIAAWPRVRAAVPGARLVFVGTGSEEEVLRRQAERLGVGTDVVFAGLRTDVARILAAASLVLLPSATEALPTTLVEAAACGKPVVATPVGGIREVVVDGRTGLLVRYGDVGGLASATARLLTDKALADQFGAAALELARQRFDMRTWAARLHAIYADARRGSAE